MAITTDVPTERGYVFEKQYVNIYRLIARKNTMDIEIGVHASQQSAQDGAPPHLIEAIFDVPFDMDDELNAWQQAYLAIKQRWPDSTDC